MYPYFGGMLSDSLYDFGNQVHLTFGNHGREFTPWFRHWHQGKGRICIHGDALILESLKRGEVALPAERNGERARVSTGKTGIGLIWSSKKTDLAMKNRDLAPEHKHGIESRKFCFFVFHHQRGGYLANIYQQIWYHWTNTIDPRLLLQISNSAVDFRHIRK